MVRTILCFGYFSLNTEQVVEIPLGAANVIEPAQFNGGQPTHFLPVPGPPNLYRRYFCTFVVNLPKGTPRNARVVWKLVQKGKTFQVPGHLESINYQIQELSAEDGARSSKAPMIKYLPNGPEGRGRSGVRTEMTAKVGQPLDLKMSVMGPPVGPQGADPDSGDDEERPYIRNGKKRLWWVKWAKHQGTRRRDVHAVRGRHLGRRAVCQRQRDLCRAGRIPAARAGHRQPE